MSNVEHIIFKELDFWDMWDNELSEFTPINIIRFDIKEAWYE